MSIPKLPLSAFLFGACLLSSMTPSHAVGAVQRTFVKSDGLDTNACSLAAPCRSFATAMANTLDGGEVIVLDSAGYGLVTIAQSVSIIAPRGVYAGIYVSAFLVPAVNIDGAGISVVLEGLTIDAGGTGQGIVFSQGNELHVNNCSIAHANGYGIVASAPNSRLFVRNTRISFGAGVGIIGSVTAVLDRVHLGNAQGGIFARDGASLSVRESVVADSAGGVLGVASTGLATRISVEDSLFTGVRLPGINLDALGGAASIATLDIIRSTIARSGPGAGAVVAINGVSTTASAPASAVLTVTESTLFENAFAISLSGNSIGLVTANVIARNALGGIAAGSGAVAHTRSNNAGVQTTPTAGAVVPVAGF